MKEISREYAMALFDLAQEQKCEKEYSEYLKEILSLFDDNTEYYDLLASYNIPYQERITLIDKALGGKYPEFIVSFMKLLCEKGRITLFSDCVNEYFELLKAKEKISDARIISVVELSEEEKTKIVNKLEKISGKKIVPHYEINSDILGGVLIYMDDTVIDGTLKNKLKNVKEVLG